MPRLGVSKKTKNPRVSEISQLKKELKRITAQFESYRREHAEAVEQQTATSEILRVIASSPADLQSVLNVVAESAARLCESVNAAILRIDGDRLRVAAAYGPIPTGAADFRFSIDHSLAGRAFREGRPIQNVAAQEEPGLAADARINQK
jgi:hypothetical protein